MKATFIVAATLVITFVNSVRASFKFSHGYSPYVSSTNFVNKISSNLNFKEVLSVTQMVQPGAYSNVSLAKLELSRLSSQFESLLKSKHSVIQKNKSDTGTIYQLRMFSFENTHSADQFRTKLKLENTDCFTILANDSSDKNAKDVGYRNKSRGHCSVQLGAYKNAISAKYEITIIRRKFRILLNGKESLAHTFQVNGGVLNRLRVTDFSDISPARTFCSKLKAKNKDCFPVSMQ